MVSAVNNIQQSFFQPQIAKTQTTTNSSESLTSFDVEDKAIISSEAKMLNELEKYNAGQGNEVDLAVTRVTTKNTVAAEVNVIQAKKGMIDDILQIGN